MTAVDVRGLTSDAPELDDAVAFLLVILGWPQSDGPPVIEWLRAQDDIERALGQLLLAPAAAAASSKGPLLRPREDQSPARSGEPSAPASPLARSGSGAPPVRARESRFAVELGVAAPVKPVVDPAGLSIKKQRLARRALWVRNIGLVFILFLVYQWWGTRFEEQRAQEHLARSFAASVVGGGALTPSQPAPRKVPAAPLPGGVMARLEIPAIHVSQYVVEGTSTDDLRKGPGHYMGSAMPGSPGNAGIAGHRTTYGAPFNRLGDLKPGDTIITTTAAGRFLYLVTGSFTVPPGQTTVVGEYGDNRLTLTTCTPEFTATDRLVVAAALQGPAPSTAPVHATAPRPLASRPLAQPGAAVTNLRRTGQGFHGDALPAVLAMVVGLVALALLYRPVRRVVPPVAAIAVLAPFWLCGLLLLFEQLNRFLPPNV